MSIKKYTKEVLDPVVSDSSNWGEVVRKLGISVHGGNRDYIKKQCVNEGVDFSHFMGRSWNKGKKRTGFTPRYKSPEEVLVFKSNRKYREHAKMLRRAMVSVGIQEICSGCGIGKEWRGKPLVIEVDHIDGDHGNCTIENLRFLCPNCHSQTKNYKTNGRKLAG